MADSTTDQLIIPSPVHTHDCHKCTFLGHTSHDRVDHYHCEGDKSFVRRFSSRPSDFGAMPVGVVKQLNIEVYTNTRLLHVLHKMGHSPL